MTGQFIRRTAVAGTWYPADPIRLAAEVASYLDRAAEPPAGEIVALVAPHAGLVYSGPVAAYAYRALATRRFSRIVLVGPSHYVAFDGTSVVPRGAFETPLGPLAIDEEVAAALVRASGLIRAYGPAHVREHSLEMQLPFLAHLAPDTPIVPLVMGAQTRDTILGLAQALAAVLPDRGALLVASTDLSHFFDAETAARLDGRVMDCVRRFDPEGLLDELERYPEHERGRYVACGGGPAVSVMMAARSLGAREARVLEHADSGDVSGDKQAVVGYLAAAFGRW
jgi:AmmeMemoRadiSam system protein B